MQIVLGYHSVTAFPRYVFVLGWIISKQQICLSMPRMEARKEWPSVANSARARAISVTYLCILLKDKKEFAGNEPLTFHVHKKS